MSAERAFFDTNILAYAYDRSDIARRKVCEKIVKPAFLGESPCFVSAQVLGELYVVLTRKVSRPLPKEQAAVIISGFIGSPNWQKVDYNCLTVKRAIEDLKKIETSFWDMMIAETMREAGVELLYTENERDFEMIPWVRVSNPIKGNSGPATRDRRASASPGPTRSKSSEEDSQSSAHSP